MMRGWCLNIARWVWLVAGAAAVLPLAAAYADLPEEYVINKPDWLYHTLSKFTGDIFEQTQLLGSRPGEPWGTQHIIFERQENSNDTLILTGSYHHIGTSHPHASNGGNFRYAISINADNFPEGTWHFASVTSEKLLHDEHIDDYYCDLMFLTAATAGGDDIVAYIHSIKGEHLLEDGSVYRTVLTPMEVVPPQAPDPVAIGNVVMSLDQDTGNCAVTVTVTGATGDRIEGASIHQGFPGINGPELLNIQSAADVINFPGGVTLTAEDAALAPEDVAYVLTDQAYVQVDLTSAGGRAGTPTSIRGQLVPVFPRTGTIVVDGTADPDYPLLAAQDTPTGFGDSVMGMIDLANGSELALAYGLLDPPFDPGRLYLLLGGNLESNFNKLEIFIDSKPGGQNVLRGDSPSVDNNGLNRMGSNFGGENPSAPEVLGSGLTFDDGFEADYWISVTGGGFPYLLSAYYAELPSGGGGQGYFLGATAAASDGALVGGTNPDAIRVTINNSNFFGVTGDRINWPTAMLTNTGVEIALDATRLNAAASRDGGRAGTGPVKVCAFVNGIQHDFVSNQVLSGIGGGGNLGEPRNVDFRAIRGNQYFTVQPPPAPGPCPGNLNGDLSVDRFDLPLLVECVSGPDTPNPGCADEVFEGGDLDNDGDIDLLDVSRFQSEFGQVCPLS